ncbi:hypothetical protein [Marinicella marina]|uniref:hypothetical protein n=1 Tax=Marinicella marina TaxID=2996016 RepID=UPI0024BD3ED8|nr:hypothetical protein [Marinicella marina]MDJ1139634.1 hypothetical protein [Marinicella marina]
MTKTTELMAVNEVLKAIGEIPINSLAVATNSDAAIALDTLRSVKTEVEQKGWWFNSRYNVAYAPSAGRIAIPANVISVRPSSGGYTATGENRNVVERDGYLYDIANNTDVFSGSVSLDIIETTDFELLPEPARRYITIRAARITHQQILGDSAIAVFTEIHELEAFRSMEAEHARNTPGGGIFMMRHKLRTAALIQDPVTSGGNQQQRTR